MCRARDADGSTHPSTKQDKIPLGIKNIKTLTKDLNIPWFAIGGIKSNNISYLKRNGFKKVALVSQLMNTEDPKEDGFTKTGSPKSLITLFSNKERSSVFRKTAK